MPLSRTVAPYPPAKTPTSASPAAWNQAASTAFHTGYQPARTLARGGQTPHQGDRPLPRRDQLPHARLGRPRPLHHPRQERRQIQPARTPTPTPNETNRKRTNSRRGGERRLD